MSSSDENEQINRYLNSRSFQRILWRHQQAQRAIERNRRHRRYESLRERQIRLNRPIPSYQWTLRNRGRRRTASPVYYSNRRNQQILEDEHKSVPYSHLNTWRSRSPSPTSDIGRAIRSFRNYNRRR